MEVNTSPHLFASLIEVYKGKKHSHLPQSVQWGDVDCTGSSSSYLAKLKGCRDELVKGLSSLSTEPAQLESLLNAYVQLACPMLPQLISKHAGTSAPGGTQGHEATGNEMDVAEGTGNHTGSSVKGDGGAASEGHADSSNVAGIPAHAHHYVGAFTWRNQLLCLQDSCWTSCGGLAMDVGYLLLNNALWRWAKAAFMLQQQGRTVASEPVLQAFKLLRQAAGVIAVLRNVLLPATVSTLELPNLDSAAKKQHIQPTSGDLSPYILEGLQAACLADAQSLSLLRACNKENAYQSAGLISSIAIDTAGMYATALMRIDVFASAKVVPGVSLPPSFPAPPNGGAIASCSTDVSTQSIGAYSGIPRDLGAYCRYKFGACRAYALAFAALTGMRKEEKAGWAVRVAQEAVSCEENAIKRLGLEYDKSARRKESERAAFDEELSLQVQRAFTRLQRDNDNVYYKRVPATMPDLAEVLPQGRRVVEVTPLELPTSPPEPFSPEDVAKLLQDIIGASEEHEADANPLPTPPAETHEQPQEQSAGNQVPTAVPAGGVEIEEANADGQNKETGTGGGTAGPDEPPAGGKKKESGCCCVQ